MTLIGTLTVALPCCGNNPSESGLDLSAGNNHNSNALSGFNSKLASEIAFIYTSVADFFISLNNQPACALSVAKSAIAAGVGSVIDRGV